MPGLLSETDKETVRRTVPKPSNKIQAVAVAKLYVAYPNRSRWTYTGLQGAAVLSNDLVGNTFWLKLVDISVCIQFSGTGHIANSDQVVKSRRDMGPRNLRYVRLQPRSNLLLFVRARRIPGRLVVRGREGG